jgi:hypothetical protein
VLLLVGASLPFFGALFGYAHETAQAAETAREAHKVRNSQAANEVFGEISRRLTAIRVIAAELRAIESRFDSVPQSRLHMLDSAAWEWSLAYPRMRALAEAYFGKTVAGYLEISDATLRDEKAHWVNKIADARPSGDLPETSSGSLTREDSIFRETGKLLVEAERDARKQLRELREARMALMKKVEEADARLYNGMATDIRDEKVGFTEEQRARLQTVAEHTLLSRFGIRPFDSRAFVITFSLLALVAISAFGLASVTGRNPWVWAVITVLFPPVLLFLLLAAPKSSGESRRAPAEVQASLRAE